MADKKKKNIFARIGAGFKGVIGELKKVIWPSKDKLKSICAVVFVVIIFFAIYLYAVSDSMIRLILQRLHLRVWTFSLMRQLHRMLPRQLLILLMQLTHQMRQKQQQQLLRQLRLQQRLLRLRNQHNRNSLNVGVSHFILGV